MDRALSEMGQAFQCDHNVERGDDGKTKHKLEHEDLPRKPGLRVVEAVPHADDDEAGSVDGDDDDPLRMWEMGGYVVHARADVRVQAAAARVLVVADNEPPLLQVAADKPNAAAHPYDGESSNPQGLLVTVCD